LTSVGNPNELDVRIPRAEIEATESERTILEQGALITHKQGPHVCSACGAPLSSLDCLRRHERNGTRFENQHLSAKC
jgi:hypothetical protein